jgi:hypothetical protein
MMACISQRNLVVWLLSGFLLLAVPFRAAAVNLLTNGGFENGNTLYWNVYNPGGQLLVWGATNAAGAAHSGSWAGYVSTFGGTSSNLVLYNLAPVANYAPGTLFKAKFWMKLQGVSFNDAARAGVKSVLSTIDPVGNPVGYSTESGVFQGTQAYFPVEYVFELPPNASQMSINVLLETGIAGGTIYIDDFSIEPVLAAAGNCLTNGGFESGTTGWVQWPVAGVTVTAETSGAQEGTKCLKIYMDSTATGGTMLQDISNFGTLGLAAGDTIRFTAWYKTGTDVAVGENIRLIKCYGIGGALDGNTFAEVASKPGAQTTWRQIYGEFTHPGSPYDGLRVYLSADLAAPGPSTVYFDDVRLEEDENVGALSTLTPLVQVARDANNTPRFKIDNVVKTPTFFFCNSGTAVLSDEVAKAATAGVDVIDIPMRLPWNGASTGMLEQALQANPNAKFLFRVELYPPTYWDADHPEQYFLNESNARPASEAQPSLASDLYFNAARKQLDDLVRFFHNSSYRDKILGYHANYLSGGEWFYPATDANFFDFSEINRVRFGNWCKTRYANNITTLNTAWGTSFASFAAITIPAASQWTAGDDGVFRKPAAAPNGHRQVGDYLEYHNQTVTDRALEICRKVKDLTTSRSLAAAFYGYQNELIANATTRGVPHTGHLALRRMLASNAIDMICAPFSYYDRTAGQPQSLHDVADTITMAGKLYLNEDDMRTYLWNPPDIAGLWVSTESDTLNALRRNMGNTVGHNYATWWCDLAANGSFNSTSIWTTIKKCVDSYTDSITNTEATKPQIALIYDEDTPLWLKSDSYNLSLANGYQQRSFFQSCGAQVGYYHIEDLPNLPSSVKLIIFVNCWRLTSAEETLINNAKTGNRTLLWQYAPGYVTETNLDLTRMNTLTGFTLAKYTTAVSTQITVANSGYPITNGVVGHTFGNTGTITPTFYATGSGYINLGNYSSSARPGLVMQQFTNWRSIFCGAATLSTQMLRAIARDSGVNLLDTADVLTQSDAVNYNGRYMYVYGGAAGTRWLQLPNEEVANGGFERYTSALPTSGMNCWISPMLGALTASISTTGAHTGSNCVQTGSVNNSAGQYIVPLGQRVQLESGKTYTISCWIYTSGLNTASASAGDYIYLAFQPVAWTANGRVMAVAEGTTAYLPAGTWTQYTTTYTHVKTSDLEPEMIIALKIYGRYTATNIKIDDISVREQGSRTVTVTDYMTGGAVTTSSGTGWPCTLAANEQKIYKLQ